MSVQIPVPHCIVGKAAQESPGSEDYLAMSMMEFDIVAATDEDRGIGRAGRIPWQLPGDLAHFRDLTTSVPRSAVVMGRTTWQSLPGSPRPLPGRLNVVLTRDPALQLPTDVIRGSNLGDALRSLRARFEAGRLARVFIIGGAEVFRHALPLPSCRRVHLTRVEGRFGCDTHLPPLPNHFVRLSASATMLHGDLRYRFETYDRPRDGAT
jgi:dihydrofolate reductase